MRRGRKGGAKPTERGRRNVKNFCRIFSENSVFRRGIRRVPTRKTEYSREEYGAVRPERGRHLGHLASSFAAFRRAVRPVSRGRSCAFAWSVGLGASVVETKRAVFQRVKHNCAIRAPFAPKFDLAANMRNMAPFFQKQNDNVVHSA